MAIPESVIRQIAEKADIRDVAGEYTSLAKKGNRYWGLCPFHGEKTASFAVTPESGLFYCFGCGKGGTVFTFIMEIEHLSFVEAVEFLGRKVGIEVGRESGEISEAERRKDVLKELFRRAAGSFHYLLSRKEAGKKALDYLTGRAILKETIEKFQIGYAPANPFWLADFLEKHNYSAEFLRTTGLFSSGTPGRAFFVNRIVFPIFSPRGDIIAFGGRILEGNGPKYLNSSESDLFKKGDNLYGFFQAKDSVRKLKSVVVVEGYMDVIALHQAGVPNVVAPLGTSFTPEQGRLLRRFADSVVLFFDGDDVGLKATRKTAEICETLEFQVFAAEAPPGKDPADFVRDGQTDELQKILKYPINILDFLLNKSRDAHDSAVSEGKELIIRDLFPYIESMVSSVRRDSALTKISDVLEIEKSAIQGDLLRRIKTSYRKKEDTIPEKQEGLPSQTPELVLMIAAIGSRDVFSFIRSRLSLEDFEDRNGRDVYISLEECYRSGSWNKDVLLEKIENNAVREFIVKKLVSDEFAINQEQLVKDAVWRIRKRSLEKLRDEVVREMKRADQDRITELQEKKMYLDGELEKLRVTGNE